MKLFAIFVVGVVVACSTPAILAPTYDAHGCNEDAERWCPGARGCCLAGDDCDVPSCPADSCCDGRSAGEFASRRPPRKVRRP